MPDIKAAEAEHGKKMIELRVRFWTNDIAPKDGQIIPKEGWDAGVVRVQGNTAHGIEPGQPMPFNGMAAILPTIEKALIASGIRLHLSRRSSKYLKSDRY